jgi:hypothetical protein
LEFLGKLLISPEELKEKLMVRASRVQLLVPLGFAGGPI